MSTIKKTSTAFVLMALMLQCMDETKSFKEHSSPLQRVDSTRTKFHRIKRDSLNNELDQSIHNQTVKPL